jgi:hypothetical protein
VSSKIQKGAAIFSTIRNITVFLSKFFNWKLLNVIYDQKYAHI